MGVIGFGNKAAYALSVMRAEKGYAEDLVPVQAIKAAEELIDSTKDIWPEVRRKIAKLIREELPLEYPKEAVWWYSVLLELDKTEEVLWQYVCYVREHRKAFSVNTQYFLFYQLSNKLFLNAGLDQTGGRIKEELWLFFREIVDEFAEQIDPALLVEIPVEKRNKDVVLVLTEQFLSVMHGPTKSALDRCKTLISVMGKKVLLLNTGELLTQVGEIPVWGQQAGCKLDKLNGESVQTWKGCSIPFYQCEESMPNIQTLEELLRCIRDMAPERIIAIGRGGILGNLADRIVPMLAVGMIPSDLEITCGTYQTLGRRLNEEDIKLLSCLGYTREHVIECVFTSGLKPQTEHVTRTEIGWKDDDFVIAVVGGRLGHEVTEEFLRMLSGILKPDMYVAFMGHFYNYEERLKDFPEIHAQSSVQWCDDILSRMELTDLYINPLRRGGGTSCVEAMFKGVPVVSVDFGDVAVNAGEDFCVKDYAEMQDRILRYYNDIQFYKAGSELAKKRAERLLDTDGEFVKILNEMDRRSM